MPTTHSLESIIQMYRRHNLPKLEAHLANYRRLTMNEAVSHAALAERVSEKTGLWNRHDHQRRLKRSSLQAGLERLQQTRIEDCRSFHELLTSVERVIGGIPGIGELMVYDTSLRLGAKLGLEPDRVYLHSGTRTGAKRLGLRTDRKWLSSDELPADLRQLPPCQVEDLLCIYKDHLSSGGL